MPASAAERGVLIARPAARDSALASTEVLTAPDSLASRWWRSARADGIADVREGVQRLAEGDSPRRDEGTGPQRSVAGHVITSWEPGVGPPARGYCMIFVVVVADVALVSAPHVERSAAPARMVEPGEPVPRLPPADTVLPGNLRTPLRDRTDAGRESGEKARAGRPSAKQLPGPDKHRAIVRGWVVGATVTRSDTGRRVNQRRDTTSEWRLVDAHRRV